ncbi:MAG: HlyD family efflux transporter periplasmic adaptor subunit [Gammaproteobacteria bacterium]
MLLLIVTACSAPTPLPLVGTLERDRIELVAEAQEPIVQIPVHEGQQVAAGQVILQLDTIRYQALIDQALAACNQAKARIAGDQATLLAAQKSFARIQALVNQRVRSPADLDAARAALDTARANLDADTSALEGEQAALADTRLTLARLTVRAPRAAVVDSLPFHLGERPPVHAVVAVLLATDSAYAQIYVPEPLLTQVRPGLRATIRFDGDSHTYAGSVRFVSSDAAFTPYYALNDRDRSRLVYLAKVYLDEGKLDELPTGAPVSVDFPALHQQAR